MIVVFDVSPVNYSDPDLHPLAGQYYFISCEKPLCRSHEPLGS